MLHYMYVLYIIIQYIILQNCFAERYLCTFIAELVIGIIIRRRLYRLFRTIACGKINYNYCFFNCDRCAIRALSIRASICNRNDVAINHSTLTRMIFLSLFILLQRMDCGNCASELIDAHCRCRILFPQNIHPTILYRTFTNTPKYNYPSGRFVNN